MFDQLADLYAQAGFPVSDNLSVIQKITLSCLAPATWASYVSCFKKFVRFCAGRGFSPLPAAQPAVLEYALFLAQEGTVRVDGVQVYFSAINTVHELVGLPKPARGPELARFRAGWARAFVDLEPLDVLASSGKVPCIPARIVKRLYEQLDLLPTASQAREDALYVVLAFRLFLRPSTLVSVWWSEVSWLSDRWVLRVLAQDWKDVSGRIGRSTRMPVVDLTDLPCLREALRAAVRARGGTRLFSFESVAAAGRAFSRAVQSVDADAAVVLTQYSCRRGGASSARAVGVPLDVIEGVGGWAANSSAMRQHYLDRSVPGCPDALFFFRALLPGGGAAQFGAPLFH